MKFQLSLFAFLVSIFYVNNLNASTYTFTEIVNTRDDLIIVSSPSLANDGDVSFSSIDRFGVTRIQLSDDGVIRTFANTTGSANILTSPVISDEVNERNGNIAYIQIDSPDLISVVSNSGFRSVIASTLRSEFEFFSTPSINSSGNVAFIATEDTAFGRRGISLHIGDGRTLETIADIADPSGRYREFSGQPSLNNLGDVAFIGNLRTGGDELAVAKGDSFVSIANTLGSISNIGNYELNDRGEVAFLADLTDGSQAIIVGDGSSTTRIAETGDDFADFGFVSINNVGDIAFLSFPAPFTGAPRETSLNFYSEGIISTVISTGDTLDGLLITSIFFGRESLNESGDLVFRASFADGSSGIYRADFNGITAVPLPAALPFFLIGITGIGAVRRKQKTLSA